MRSSEREGWIPYDGPSAGGPGAEVAPVAPAASRERPVVGGTLADPPRRSLAGRRFTLIFAALGVVAVAAVVVLATLLVREPGSTAALQERWADFQPSGSSYARTQDIADHVSKKYTLDSGAQLAAAIAGPPVITSNQPEGSSQILVSTIAITPDLPAGGSSSVRDIVLVNGQNSVQYMLCGYGQNCSIATGQPSVERHTLLRREAVELALYTFKFLPTIDSVSVFLPPRPDNSAAPTMVFLQRRDVTTLLGKPLEESLAGQAPRIGKMDANELALVNRVTGTHLYQYNYTQAQDGSAVMLLDPVVT